MKYWRKSSKSSIMRVKCVPSEVDFRGSSQIKVFEYFDESGCTGNNQWSNWFQRLFLKVYPRLRFMNYKKSQNCWINFFQFTCGHQKKIEKLYANNKRLAKLIKKNVEKGLRNWKLFDKSIILLSECVPILNCNQLISKNILDFIISKKRFAWVL